MTTRTHSSLFNKKNQHSQQNFTSTAIMQFNRLFIVFILLFPSFTITAEQGDESIETNTSFFDHFSEEDIVNVRIETNITDLIENRKRQDYLPTTLQWEDKDGKWHELKAGVKPRGKFRRRICDFPPLKIKLSKDGLRNAGFTPFNKLKLVTHCVDDKSEGNDNVLKEYLSYKMYNELTPNSFRVQLVKITYVDNVGDYGTETRYGFFIESKSELAERLGGEVCKSCFNPAPEKISVSNENTMAVFQYMIGNADWNLKMNKNVVLIKKANSQKMVLVPYDFDFAGIVDAPYAIPNPDFGLRTVQDRVFLGSAVNNQQMKKTFSFFVEKRAAIRKSIKAIKLKYASKQFVFSYINDFYEEIDHTLNSSEVSNIYQSLKDAHIQRANQAAGKPVGK